MSDFQQTSGLATLHDLGERPIDALIEEITRFSKSRPIALVIPCLGQEIGTPTFVRIMDVVSRLPYISEVVLGLDNASVDVYRRAIVHCQRLPQRARALWLDGPRISGVRSTLLPDMESVGGKGANLWHCFGYLHGRGEAAVAAVHDADIVTYDARLLTRLVYAVADPDGRYRASKGYYARFDDRTLHGRLTRLLISPLAEVAVRLAPASAYAELIHNLRYPLAGELAIDMKLAGELPMSIGWGVELGTLAELQQRIGGRLCQVEVAARYDHRHRPMLLDGSGTSLVNMAVSVTAEFIRGLAEHAPTRELLAREYPAAAERLLEAFAYDARINGLRLDMALERKAIGCFTEIIADTREPRKLEAALPSWSEVERRSPRAALRLVAAVDADYEEGRGSADSVRPVAATRAGACVERT
jgi:glucosyl-3-phosphoglycerate synthase